MARNKKGKVLVNGRVIPLARYEEMLEFNKGMSKYLSDRREASKRVKQIRDKSGPRSMEWVQSALFLYACKKNGLDKDLKRAIWSYTSALIVKLEEYVTAAEKIASRDNIEDSFHFVALQLRASIRNHMKLLEMFKDDTITVPLNIKEGRQLCAVTHKPSNRDDYEAMSYMIGEFRQKNPGIDDILPQKDDDM